MKTNRQLFLKHFFVSLSFCLSVIGLSAQTYTINTVAGNGVSGFSGDGGQATNAQIANPYGVFVDASENIYIPDDLNNRVRIVNSNGVINTFAGTGVSGFSGDGGQATAAQLKSATSAVGDPAGNLYIADGGNNRIRMVKPNGVISTIGGNGVATYAGDGGQATAASFNFPCAITRDGAGNLYIADLSNQRIRMINTNGVITTVAGNGVSGFSGDGAQATNAQLSNPFGVAVDASGNLYIADQFNHRVREVKPNGIINTIAGNGVAAYTGDGGQATSASLDRPFDVAVDAANNIYIADYANDAIRKVSNAGVITTLAGTGVAGFSGDGGPATAAKLNGPSGFSLDPLNNMFISDQSNDRIREMVLTCSLTTSITASTDNTCGNGNAGSATTTPASGSAPYVYSWNTVPSQTNATATGLSAGTYKVIVTDNNGCTATAGITITAPPALTNVSNTTNPIICVGSCTNITAAAGGGTGAYTYAWNTGATTATTNVCPAITSTYTSTVTDANGCSTTASVTVTVNTCAGVPDVNNLEEQIKFYPEPFVQSLNINVVIDEPVSLTMFNIMGEKVGAWTIEKGLNTINTQAYAAGVYVMQIKTKSGVITKKLFKVD